MAADTKERILDRALEMFSRDGYKGTNLRDLAASLNLSKSALYRHFESKDAIFDAMIERLKAYYEKGFGLEKTVPDSLDDFKDMVLRKIDFTIHDNKIRRARMIFSSEQFQDERLAALTTEYFLENQERLFAEIFDGMMQKGLLKQGDPQMLAFAFTTPIAAMVHLCDREPGKEQEAMEKIRAFIDMFLATYGTEA